MITNQRLWTRTKDELVRSVERLGFPADLKRGVLSQDGLYDFLTEWQDQNGK